MSDLWVMDVVSCRASIFYLRGCDQVTDACISSMNLMDTLKILLCTQFTSTVKVRFFVVVFTTYKYAVFTTIFTAVFTAVLSTYKYAVFSAVLSTYKYAVFTSVLLLFSSSTPNSGAKPSPDLSS